jgi:MFS family permease
MLLSLKATPAALRSYLTGHAAWASSFQYRDFRLLWTSTVLESVGMGMENVALGWLVFEMTDSPFMVGLAAAARMAPFFFLGILSGAVADRVDRRIFLRVITLGVSLTGGLMALLLIMGVAQVWHIMALAIATGCFWAFTMTTRQAYTYDIVGPQHALNGLSLNALSQRFGGVIGSLIAGVIIATSGIGGQYIAVSASYIIAAAVLLATRDVAQAAPTRREGVIKNLAGGIQAIRQNRTLMMLMFLTATTEVFGFTHQSLLPVFARDVLGVGAVGLGIMTAVRQGGGILALLLLAHLGNTSRKGILMFAMATGFGLGQMAFSLTSSLVLFLLVLTLVNACASGVDTLYKALMQDNVPNEQRGRAMGLWVLSIGLGPLGHIEVGGLAGVLGAPRALLINGGILTFISLASSISLPRIRRLG